MQSSFQRMRAMSDLLGIVVTTSPTCSLYNIVVLPAPSKPNINIRRSFCPTKAENIREKKPPADREKSGNTQAGKQQTDLDSLKHIPLIPSIKLTSKMGYYEVQHHQHTKTISTYQVHLLHQLFIFLIMVPELKCNFLVNVGACITCQIGSVLLQV